MTTPVHLPVLGNAVESATISQWLKSVREPVVLGEPVVEVSTDKVDREIESPVSGVLAEILVAEDETARVGSVLAIVSSAAVTNAAAPEPGAAPGLVVAPKPGILPVSEIGPGAAPVPVPEPEAAANTENALAVSSRVQTPTEAVTPTLRGTTQMLTRLRKTIALIPRSDRPRLPFLAATKNAGGRSTK